MAYKVFDGTEAHSDLSSNSLTIHAGNDPIDLPDNSYIRDANMTRDGMDLTLDSPHGTITIEGYFAAETAPDLVAPDGQTLTPHLVDSFTTSPQVYAANTTMTDESPVGGVSEVTGDATVTHLDGSVEQITKGTPIFQGDIIETGPDGAVNIVFSDETSFAVSEDARLAIDEYVYDPSTSEGSQDFSVLKGVFVFTSGLIGREDPDDVNIDTPSGSIGIRGTIIAGDVNAGEITVVEGAIVVRDFAGNEMTLANQYETAKFTSGGGVENMGQMAANDVAIKFAGVSGVAPTLFSSINDSAAESAPDAPANDAPANDASGTVDNNADGNVDGTVDGAEQGAAPTSDAPAGDAPAADPAAQPQPKAPAPMGDAAMGITGNDMGLTGNDAVSDGAKPAGMGNVANKAMNTVQANGGAEAVGQTSAPPPAGTAPPPPSGTTATAPKPPPPPADTLQDPTTIGTQPPPTAAVNGPVHIASSEAAVASFLDYSVGNALGQVNIAPNAAGDANFFAAGNGQNWAYHFDNEFVSFDQISGGTALTYELSADTIALLNDTTFRADFLDLGQGVGSDGWDFDAANGKLELFFKFTFGSAPTDFAIEIRAIDTATGEYNTSPTDPNGYITYDFELFDGSNTSAIDGTAATSYVGGGAGDTFALGASSVTSNQTLMGGSGMDAITVGQAAGFAVTNNDINSGDGNDNITINNSAQNNNIISGYGNDTFTIHHARNKLWGMDGDDKFILNLGDTANTLNILTGADTGMLIDGGQGDFNMGSILAASTQLTTNGFFYENDSGGGTGTGDVLKLTAAGSLDFTAIDDRYIRGIERLDLLDATAQTVTLGYQDIIEMTDHNNTLIISRGANDTVNVSVSGLTKVGDDISLDDGYAGHSGQYDVYSDGTVTLLVEDPTGNDGGINIA